MTDFTYTELAEEARREVKLRQHVYPRLVDQSRLSPAAAKRRIAMMEQIARKLDKLATGERLL